MILITHISIALFSVMYTTYLLISPSKNKIAVSYGLVSATLISGTYLVVSTKASIISACISGLIYTTIVMVGILLARRKLEKANLRIEK